eukprot:CAMPEP_0170640368 /NCGR_PEP_ID=MMETSP0224-20130122/40186_1 /TAXON_ID=285029 /ORGANISM="Togula jolla, Strain CCCM 725" /LENGTH=73 /DNA_ID=CAMNT_0010970867 /DNA_START=583 /DNA_END=802 /DNA_ORIENTATION=+
MRTDSNASGNWRGEAQEGKESEAEFAWLWAKPAAVASCSRGPFGVRGIGQSSAVSAYPTALTSMAWPLTPIAT